MTTGFFPMKISRNSRVLPALVGAAALSFAVGACVQRGSTSMNKSAQAQSTQTAQTQTAQTPIRNADDLAALSSTYAQISRVVTPAVVNIQSESVVPGRVFRDPMNDFFGGNFGGRVLREPDQKSQSLGSGVIIDGSGLIITNNHVIKNATRITVTLTDRRRFTAKLLGTDADSDIAMLKIDGQNLPTLKWADSDKISVGDIVLAIGSPFNLSSTVTQGIISAKGRSDLGISAYEDFLQTDAAINPGNSGGALVDINGDLIGINSAILSESGGNQGIGLAIPANLARSIGAQLTDKGRVTRGWLGVTVQPLTGRHRRPTGFARRRFGDGRLPAIAGGTSAVATARNRRNYPRQRPNHRHAGRTAQFNRQCQTGRAAAHRGVEQRQNAKV